jgi:hypothetical protein
MVRRDTIDESGSRISPSQILLVCRHLGRDPVQLLLLLIDGTPKILLVCRHLGRDPVQLLLLLIDGTPKSSSCCS